MNAIDQFLRESVERVQDLEGLAENLENLLNSGCYVWIERDGTRVLLQGRALVERLKGLKIHIYPDEHPPPHFHVSSPDINATFSILDCTLLKGSVDRKTRELIVHWHGAARPKLVAFWNNTRPTDCPVGPIDNDEA